MDAKSLGRCGEESAALYLESLGYHVIGRNIHVGHAEIDIIAENDSFVVFVEVKTRRQLPDSAASAGKYGTPAAAVTPRKQATLTEAVTAYIASFPTEKSPRIDVIEVYADPAVKLYRVLSLRHIENAVKRQGKFSRREGGRRAF